MPSRRRKFSLRRLKLRRLKNPIRFDPSASDAQKGVFEISLALTMASLIIANLPYAQVPVLTEGEYVAAATEFPIDVATLERPSKAGWPYSYYTGHSTGNDASVGNWSLGNLLIDFFVGCFLMSAVGLYFWPRRQHLRRAKRWRRKFAYSIATGVAVAGVLAYFGLLHLQYAADTSAAEKIGERGQVVRMAFLPKVIAPITPEFLSRSRLRIVLAKLDRPDDEMLKLALRQSELRSLRLSDGTYDEARLRDLPNFRYLQDLGVYKHGLASETVESWRACPLLFQVNLADSPIEKEQLEFLAEIPKLSRLSLLGSKASLFSIGSSDLKKSVEELIVSCPTGESATLPLKEWFRLRRVSILSPPGPANNEILRISAPALPQLEAVIVAPNQLIDLTGTDLPVFRGVFPLPTIDFALVDKSNSLDDLTAPRPARPYGSGAWVRNFALFGCDRTASLIFEAKSIGDFAIKDCDGLRELTLLGAGAVANRETPPQPIDQAVRQRLIGSIGEISGPETLRLPGMTLSDLNLAPLTYNVGIDELDLSGAKIDLNSVRTLLKMNGLAALNLTDIPLKPQTFRWINESFLNLNRLTVSPRYAETFEFRNHSALSELRLGEFDEALIKTLSLVNLKQFHTPLKLADDVNAALVSDLPALEGLGIPAPCRCEIDGVPGLKWFASGGANCTDDVVQEVLQASDMERLSIVYPQATLESFAGIKSLRKLKKLNLAGCPIDDKFISSWDLPPSLQALVLDDCLITDQVVTNLMTQIQLEGLSLARTSVTDETMEVVSELKNLSVLGLAGMTIESERLRELASLPRLRHVDLADARLPPDAIDILMGIENLQKLNVSGCEISETDLERLRQAKPDLKLTKETAWDFVHAIPARGETAELHAGFKMPCLIRNRFLVADGQTETTARDESEDQVAVANDTP